MAVPSKALVFAAGLGTRLRPITDSMPKAMVPLCGKPLIYHVIRKLSSCGISSFVVNVHHFPDQIEKYLSSEEEFRGLDIRISREEGYPRETGGGILHARSLLSGGDFLVHNVDIVSNLDIPLFCSRSMEGDLSRVLVSQRSTQRYLLFDGEGGHLVGWTNIATGAVKSPYRDIDPPSCTMRAFAGIHHISGDVFSVMDEISSHPEDFPLYNERGEVVEESDSAFSDVFSIIDFYLRACRQWKVRAFTPDGLQILDIGKKETLAQAEDFLESL